MHLRKLRKSVLCLAALSIVGMAPAVRAQTASLTVTLDEKFFDTLLDAVFKNFDPPEFSVAGSQTGEGVMRKAGYSTAGEGTANCRQTIRILREMGGVRTAVRFRDGNIYVPLAFSGNYEPPFVGCVDFAGWAEANIDMEFEPKTQRLVGRARILNVNLSGTGGIGGSLIARMLQGSIDKKLNPIEIFSLEKLSFGVPIQQTGNLRMRAVAARPVMGPGVINLHIDYIFLRE